MEVVAPLVGLNPTLIMVLISFGILYFVVKKFFFEKIHNFMEAREQKVKDQFDNAEAAEKLADRHLAEYKGKLEQAEIERSGVLKDAKERADQRAKQIIDEADRKANEIIQQAFKEIERERAQFTEEMRNQLSMLAVFAAEKIIERELDPKSHMGLIDGILEQGEGGVWKH
jgi:F-type H+-transporting ATPase subunit b